MLELIILVMIVAGVYSIVSFAFAKFEHLLIEEDEDDEA
jgi:hypothetical protein